MNGDITGKCDMRSLSKKYSRAFTLYELIISIVLFALAASLVITFITYMSAFSEKNSASTQRVREQLALRKEIDFGFPRSMQKIIRFLSNATGTGCCSRRIVKRANRTP